MARLEAQSKLLYYPTPLRVVELIASWFKADARARLVDPCCGKGEALAQFAQLVCPEAETWGIEISYSRAIQAQKRLHTVLATSFYEMRPPSRWSNAGVSLAFNNPPYDWSSFEEVRNGQKKKLRHEALFIEGVTPKIVAGGHQVIIVPRAILGDERLLGSEQISRVARHLLGWYENVIVLRFPDEEYARFKQVVILACAKRSQYAPPTKEAIEGITSLADEAAAIPILQPGFNAIDIPPLPPGKTAFVFTPHDPGQLLQLARQCSPIGTPAFERATYVRPIGAPFTPAMPLSVGHITMMIAGQETGVLSLNNTDGKPLLVKGMSRKLVEVTARDVTNEQGKYTHTNVTEREKHAAVLTLAHANGELAMLQSPSDVADFVTSHAGPIAEAILERNQPLYALDPSQAEWEVTSRSAKGLPPLPNRSERGLFDVQRHFAIAAARVMKSKRHCILNAEMGFGKTSTSIAALELMNRWPVLVLCPGHMVWKWKRDLERASDPDDPIVARVITRPVLAEPPAWLALRQRLESHGAVIEETVRSQVDPATPNDPGGRRKVTITFARFSREAPTVDNQDDVHAAEIQRLIRSLAWKDAQTKTLIQPQIHKLAGGLVFEYVDRDEYTLFDFQADFNAGRLGRKAVAVIAFDPAKYDAGAEETPAVRLLWKRLFDEREGRFITHQTPTCPGCGAVVDPAGRFCPACGGPLFNFTRWRRTGLARLIQRKLRHFFKVYVGDEIHKCQNGRSDIGAADQRLISSIRCSLALTGTLFGGTAGSLFYLLFRRVPELRRLYAFSEKNRFIDHYGVWERVWDQAKPFYEGEVGASTGIKRWNSRARELPGVAPAVIRFLLPITLFGNITDLGYELPPLHEDVEQLPMTDALAEQVHRLEQDLLKQALDLVHAGDVGALAAWFAACRFRPASAFRHEQVEYLSRKGKGQIHLNLPAVISPQEPWLPKELRLAEIVRNNMSQNRKTLAFVEQSGQRDIRERLRLVIETLVPGGSLALVETPQVGALSASDMTPAKREAWIRLSAPKMDALLVNPRLVETGLDLVMFSDLVFYEVTTSLYVLWQAIRRVWRLGQNKDVNVTFLSYAGTIEAEILRRMGLKMKYAQLLYGKEAAGVLVETDGEDLQREIINAALEGKALKNAGEMAQKLSIFTTGTERRLQVTQSPMGSPVAASPVLIPAIELPGGQAFQLTLFPGFEPVPLEAVVCRRRRRQRS